MALTKAAAPDTSVGFTASERDTLEAPGRRAPLRPGLVAGMLLAIVISVLFLTEFANVKNESGQLLPYDDAYISFSYAKNLARGDGLTMTAGSKPVEAYSNPLLVGVLATLAVVGISIPLAAMWIGVICALALGYATYRLTRTLAPRAPPAAGAIAGALFVLLPVTALNAVSGLETVPAALVLTIGVIMLTREADARRLTKWSALVCLAFTLLRPEGLILFAIWAVLLLPAVGWRALTRWTAWFAVPFAAFELFRIGYFGAFIPNSVTAKGGYTLRQMISHSEFHTRHFWAEYRLLLVLALVAALIRPWYLRIASSAIAFTVAFGAVASLRDGYVGLRYFYTAVPVIFACAAACIGSVVSRVRDRWRAPVWMGVAAAGVAVALVMTSTQYRQQAYTNLPHRFDVARASGRLGDLVSESFPQTYTDDYQPILASWLSHHSRPSDLIALDEVGVVGFHGNLRVLDLGGLADSHIAELPGRGGHKGDPAYVFAQAPRFFGFMSGRCLCVALEDDRLYSTDPRMFAYDLVLSLRQKRHPSALVYERRRGVVSAYSLDSSLSKPVRIAQHSFGPALLTSLSPSQLAALGDVLRLPVSTGAGWDANRPDGATQLRVHVPARASFEVNIGSISHQAGGRWEVAVGDGQSSGAQRIITSDARAAFGTRMALDLSRWSGRTVTITMRYLTSCGSAGCAPAGPLFLEPRLLTHK